MSLRSKNEDRLSSLPEEILSHILSLMPTKFAVRTCILSKRWRNTWTFVTNLDFNDDHHTYTLKHFLEFVDRVLEYCKTPQLNLFRLRCFVHVPLSKVSKWVNEAVGLNACELDIDISPAELPITLFNCKTLTNLRLVLSYDCDVFKVSIPVMLPRLKTLDLYGYCKPFVDVLKFIQGCPVLESLSLWMMLRDYMVRDFSFNIPTLKRLELKICGSFNNKVVLNVPNLEYLFVGGRSCPHFVIKDVSYLVEANACFYYSGDYHEKAELLKRLSRVKSLSWSTSTFNHSYSPLPKFLNLRHLELKHSCVSQWSLLIQIIESSPELENFSFREPKGIDWCEPQSVPTCMLSKLKTIKITKCKGRKCNLQFLEFMLGNAGVLKKLTIICESLGMEEERELYARLMMFPKSSRFCEIHFVGKWLKGI